jgi:hypothetical protein
MATHVMTIPYSSEVFHKISSLAPIRTEFDGRGGLQFVQDTLQPIIERHGLEEVFGVCVVHRHFDIGSITKLV